MESPPFFDKYSSYSSSFGYFSVPINNKCSQKWAKPISSGLSDKEPILTPKEAELVSESGSYINKAFKPFGSIFIKQSNLSLLDFSIEVIIEESDIF